MTATAIREPSSANAAATSDEINEALSSIFGPCSTTKAKAKKKPDENRITVVEREFAVLPTRQTPRWLVPLSSRRCTLRALEEIRVFAPGAKMIRSGLKLIAATGALRTLAFTTSVPIGEGLLDKIAERMEEPNASFVVTIGSPSRFRKLTVAVLDRENRPIAFVKVPMSKEAASRISLEGDFLENLAQTPLASVVPSVLFRSEWNKQPVLCLSPGPRQASAMRFGSEHRALLQLFWSVQATDREGEALVNEVASRVAAASESFTPETASLIAEALERAQAELQSAIVGCGLSHGDFAPWNLRNTKHGLFAFDWESAAWGVPNIWDIAHYDTQLVTLLGRKSRFGEITRSVPFSRGLYLLYLAQAVVNTIYELGESSRQVSDRLRLLKDSLQE